MYKKSIFYLLISLVLFITVAPLYAQVSATASLNTKSFSIDEAAQLTITVQGVRSSSSIHPPEVDGLLFHHRGQSTRMEYNNGTYSASISSIFLVEATREGHFTIPPFVIDSKEGKVKTSPLEIDVTGVATKKSMPNASAQSGKASTRLRSGEAEEIAFMRVIPSKTKSYNGELVPIQVKVYFREGVQANLNSLPQFQGEGFALQQLQGEPQQSSEIVGNNRYSVLSWESVLSGVKEGTHTVSMELEAILLLRERPTRRQRPRGLFSDPFFDDNFFDSFFGSYRQKVVKVASPMVEMTVVSLPEAGKPESFSGAIGDFRLEVAAKPKVVSKGDPVTLTMTVSGIGNFDRVQAPQLQDTTGWRSYTPSSEFLQGSDKRQGKKVFEQALVAKATELSHIPSVVFSYFDPVAEKYKELHSEPIALEGVKSGSQEEEKAAENIVVSPTINKEEQPVAEQEQKQAPLPGLAPLRLERGKLYNQLEPLFVKMWFQIFCGVLILLFVLVLFVKIRNRRLYNNPQLQQKKESKRLWQIRQKELDAALQQVDSTAFLSHGRNAIQEQLGLRWDMEPAAITLVNLQKRLPDSSVLLRFFKVVEEAAYGGQALSEKQMHYYATQLNKEFEKL